MARVAGYDLEVKVDEFFDLLWSLKDGVTPVTGEADNIALEFVQRQIDGTPDVTAAGVAENVDIPGDYVITLQLGYSALWKIRAYHPTYAPLGKEWDVLVTPDGPILMADLMTRAAPGDAMDLITDAVNADALAADAVAEIQDGLALESDVDDRFDALDAAVAALAHPGDAMDLIDGAIIDPTFADNAITDRALAPDVDTYQAKVVLVDDDSGAADRYVVSWFKNAQPLFGGVTEPKIRVRDLGAGVDLIAETAMTDDDEGDFEYVATGAGRIASGRKYQVVVKATIDGLERPWKQPVGRDTTT